MGELNLGGHVTIAEQFQRRCEEFPQNAVNLNEFQAAVLQEIHAASTEIHMVDDGETLFAFAFPDGSAMTVVNCKGLRFALLRAKELRAIRKARHLTKKDLQDIDLCAGDDRVGREPENK